MMPFLTSVGVKGGNVDTVGLGEAEMYSVDVIIEPKIGFASLEGQSALM